MNLWSIKIGNMETNIEWFLPCRCKECVCYYKTFGVVKDSVYPKLTFL